MDIILQPEITEEFNALYKFVCKGEKRYYVKIVVDESNEDKLVIPDLDFSEYTSCTCPDFSFKAHLCKHCLGCIKTLRDMGININIENNEWRRKNE